MNPGDEDSFDRLARYVSSSAGMALDRYKDKCLRRRIAVRMRAVGVHTYDEFLVRLRDAPGELQRLVDVLTINVTKFYRNTEVWQGVTRHVVPALFAGSAPVRVWSAGCASGEEPYTLAMVFAEALQAMGRLAWLDRLTIEATDIDRLSLERASDARYPASAMSEAPPEIIARWCDEEAGGQFRVRSQLLDRVRIIRQDLLRDPAPNPPYDLITCRNVIIYFDRAGQERLMQTFYEALRPGGFLLLGKVETIFGPARTRLELLDARERLYRKGT
ncbi:MAG: CheR family methyltransferase [Gemmatimonadales bacterium]